MPLKCNTLPTRPCRSLAQMVRASFLVFFKRLDCGLLFPLSDAIAGHWASRVQNRFGGNSLTFGNVSPVRVAALHFLQTSR